MAELFADAAHGRFPAVDGEVEVFGRPDGVDWRAVVVEFTGHAVVLTDLSADEVVVAGADGFGGASAPPFLRALCGADGVVEHQAVLFAGLGAGAEPPPRTSAWDEHPRVHRALRERGGVLVHGDDAVCVTVGRGLAGRCELGVEVRPDRQGTGVGTEMLTRVLRASAAGAAVYAAAAPGNAAAARTLLAAGMRPVGFEIVVHAR